MPAAKKAPRKAPNRATRSRKPAAARGPEPRESVIDQSADDVSALVAQVKKQGGAVVGAYRDPFAGQALVLASLPIKKVVATPFQRDLSKTHATRLADAIGAAGLFLDPVIAVPSSDGFWSPNGRHRLEAARRLGMRTVTALLVPDEKLAFRILALNTEKAHNLRDRSLEVVRMARSLAKQHGASRESQYTAEFESAELMTLGIIY